MGDCKQCPLMAAAVKVVAGIDLVPKPTWKIAPTPWGREVQEKMTARGLSYEQLGKIIDYSGNTVNNVVLGRRPNNGRVARAINRELGIEVLADGHPADEYVQPSLPVAV